MTVEVIPGHIIVCADAPAVAREAATGIVQALRRATESGRATLALSGGNTPRDAYSLLAREPGIDWTKVHVFWVDERAVAPNDDRSNYRWAKATLLAAPGLASSQVHRMPADSSDLASGANEYEQTIRAHVKADAADVPAFDVVVLGVGDDGHTASLFPGEPTVDIRDRLVAAVPAAPGREARLTITGKAIEHAKAVFVLAVGAAKRPALERVWASQGDVHQTPARTIRDCRGVVTWIVDRAARGASE